MSQPIKVINSLGEEELFSERKVLRSLKKAGANSAIAWRVIGNLKSQLYQGIPTAEIFKIARQELKKEEPAAALKFNLKQAIRNLGPDGFSFEKYIKEIFENYGFSAKINQFIPGRCLTYETDIVADNGKVIYFGECKYRHYPGERVDLGVGLKLFATFLDVQEDYFKKQINEGRKVAPLLITNAKFTTQIIKYAKCRGIRLLGWNYPQGEGLETMLEKNKLYPITILPSFRSYMNAAFGEAGIMLASDLLNLKDIKNFAKKVKLPLNKLIDLIEEAKILLEQDGSIVKS